jgi:signal transduction histidine kinase
LNLFNNAFYAVIQKKKELGENYNPIVSVSTKKVNGKIEIRIKDNGTGIPQRVVDKIFQPFFTTKPSGQGTGLGLSLAYDIAKAHSGEIKVETKRKRGERVYYLSASCMNRRLWDFDQIADNAKNPIHLKIPQIVVQTFNFPYLNARLQCIP